MAWTAIEMRVRLTGSMNLTIFGVASMFPFVVDQSR